MRPHLAPVALDAEDAAPFAASLPAVSGNPLDLLTPRQRVVFEALRTQGVSAVARALGLSRARVVAVQGECVNAVAPGVVCTPMHRETPKEEMASL